MNDITVRELIEQLQALENQDVFVVVEGAKEGYVFPKRIVEIRFGSNTTAVLLSRYR